MSAGVAGRMVKRVYGLRVSGFGFRVIVLVADFQLPSLAMLPLRPIGGSVTSNAAHPLQPQPRSRGGIE